MSKHDLEIVQLPLGEVNQHPDNPNNGRVDVIAESITANGFYQPILVQKSTGHIIAGNHRYAAAVELGMSTIPAILLDVSDIEAKRIMVVDNRSNRLGVDDPGLLHSVLEDLFETDLGFAGTGFGVQDFQDLVFVEDHEEFFGGSDDEPEVNPIGVAIRPIIKNGQCVRLEVLPVDGYGLELPRVNELLKALKIPRWSKTDAKGISGGEWDV